MVPWVRCKDKQRAVRLNGVGSITEKGQACNLFEKSETKNGEFSHGREEKRRGFFFLGPFTLCIEVFRGIYVMMLS